MELLRSLDPMAVRASNIALSDFRHQPLPAAVVEHRADRADLLRAVPVIELKDN
jgi:hypothetical protein